MSVKICIENIHINAPVIFDLADKKKFDLTLVINTCFHANEELDLYFNNKLNIIWDNTFGGKLTNSNKVLNLNIDQFQQGDKTLNIEIYYKDLLIIQFQKRILFANFEVWYYYIYHLLDHTCAEYSGPQSFPIWRGYHH